MQDPSSAPSYIASPDVLVTDLNDELVLLHATTSQMYSLNEVARRVWQRLPATRAELISVMLEHYEVGADEATADLNVLLDDLQRLDMVKSG